MINFTSPEIISALIVALTPVFFGVSILYDDYRDEKEDREELKKLKSQKEPKKT